MGALSQVLYIRYSLNIPVLIIYRQVEFRTPKLIFTLNDVILLTVLLIFCCSPSDKFLFDKRKKKGWFCGIVYNSDKRVYFLDRQYLDTNKQNSTWHIFLFLNTAVQVNKRNIFCVCFFKGLNNKKVIQILTKC